MNYLKLSDHYYAFVYSSCYRHYLRLSDYKIFEENAIGVEDNLKSQFLLLPSVRYGEIEEAFIESLNNRKYSHCFKRLNNNHFEQFFHCFLEDNNLMQDWRDFEKKYLIAFASEWCRSQGIKYSTKPSFPRM